MQKEKILVVDDEKNICDLLRMYLEKEGFAVVMAMCAMGVYSRTEEGALAASALLDRATAAEMLYATLLACK